MDESRFYDRNKLYESDASPPKRKKLGTPACAM